MPRLPRWLVCPKQPGVQECIEIVLKYNHCLIAVIAMSHASLSERHVYAARQQQTWPRVQSLVIYDFGQWRSMWTHEKGDSRRYQAHHVQWILLHSELNWRSSLRESVLPWFAKKQAVCVTQQIQACGEFAIFPDLSAICWFETTSSDLCPVQLMACATWTFLSGELVSFPIFQKMQASFV